MRFLTKLCIWHIGRASVEDIDEIMAQTFRRREELFPEYDPVYLAVPKYDREERERQLANFCKFVRRMYGMEIEPGKCNHEKSGIGNENV